MATSPGDWGGSSCSHRNPSLTAKSLAGYRGIRILRRDPPKKPKKFRDDATRRKNVFYVAGSVPEFKDINSSAVAAQP